MPPSKAIEKSIREKAGKLDKFYGDITSCRVTVVAPHRHHRKGKACVVRIDLTMSGGALVVNRLVTALTTQPDEFEKILAENHAPSKHAAHEDVYVAIRDAFNAAGRKLQDYVRRTSRTVKTYRPPFEARAIG